jgi:hypothetical protein
MQYPFQARFIQGKNALKDYSLRVLPHDDRRHQSAENSQDNSAEVLVI